MKFYFVCTDKASEEIEVIKQLQPKRLLLSYFYFKNKPLEKFIEKIGYRPEIILDSGAYSAWTSGKPVNLEKYIEYIKENEPYITGGYICLDALGDSQGSYEVWEQMRAAGLDPIPVFHYNNDESILERYIAQGIKQIAIGGTVPIKSKAKVAEWLKFLGWTYPADYHLLGSASRKILDHCDIASADASSWIMGAIMGRPRHIKGHDREAKVKRAAYNMAKLQKLYE